MKLVTSRTHMAVQSELELVREKLSEREFELRHRDETIAGMKQVIADMDRQVQNRDEHIMQMRADTDRLKSTLVAAETALHGMSDRLRCYEAKAPLLDALQRVPLYRHEHGRLKRVVDLEPEVLAADRAQQDALNDAADNAAREIAERVKRLILRQQPGLALRVPGKVG